MKKPVFTGGAPIPGISTEEGTGVKDQNLWMRNATLKVEGDATIDDTLTSRDLKVTGPTIHTDLDLSVGGDVKGGRTVLGETVLEGDFNIKCNQGQVPQFTNLSDPLSARDAITFDYYRDRSTQAYNCATHRNGALVDGNRFIDLRLHNSEDSESYTPMYRNRFYWKDNDQKKLYLKSPGIYQVAFQIFRSGGYHSGNDDPTIFLRLYTSAYEYTNLCTGDTRGFNPGNTTNTSLYSIFSIPSIGNEHPFIQVFTKIHVNIAYSMINVIWFPFGSSYKEAD
ncbi:hypothetical protein [Chlamydia trachomatis]|uniref:hypothetical protein n=1 Tax=Chlamydia trachomatis TaxID=813 RepID=UPI0003D63CBF|nr:hypothetical protein [Chlamydia trachomatis]AHC16990.1 hypothetical protein CTW3_00770 [Chlamydia trachomatis C/TW-3]